MVRKHSYASLRKAKHVDGHSLQNSDNATGGILPFILFEWDLFEGKAFSRGQLIGRGGL